MYKVVNSKSNQSVSDEKKPLQFISEIQPLENFTYRVKIIHPNSLEVIFDEEEQFQSVTEATSFANEKKIELSKNSKYRTFFEKKNYINNDKKNKMGKSYE